VTPARRKPEPRVSALGDTPQRRHSERSEESLFDDSLARLFASVTHPDCARTFVHTHPIRLFFSVMLPCPVIKSEKLRSIERMDQRSPQFLTATHAHSKFAVTHSKQSLVTFSNRNIKPSIAVSLNCLRAPNFEARASNSVSSRMCP
jgi:hypothetical protein